jgi:3-hydroxybutyryl-CoA dehydrogenase
VIGAGTMGAGIAQVALEAGWTVRLHDAQPGAADRGRQRIEAGLRRRAAKRKLATGWARERLASLGIADAVQAAVDGVDLVVEAIVEDLEAKRALFSRIDEVAPPDAILATNTSALSVTTIAAATGRPERVVGLHFFNPAPVLLLVEVVAGERTDPATADRAAAIVEAWGKTPVRSSDSPGFIVNRVNRPFTIEALRMREAGQARVAEVDAAIRGAGFPMGPFELMDLVGLDVNLAAATGVWEGLGRPDRLRPSPIQRWLVDHGRLGRKSGAGFYRYGIERDPVPEPLPLAIAPHARPGVTPVPAIVERIRSGIAAEAILARDEGVASEADIDTALWLGAAHPEGPFAWLRRTGKPASPPTIRP